MNKDDAISEVIRQFCSLQFVDGQNVCYAMKSMAMSEELVCVLKMSAKFN